jgi:hypothetical protein
LASRCGKRLRSVLLNAKFCWLYPAVIYYVPLFSTKIIVFTAALIFPVIAIDQTGCFYLDNGQTCALNCIVVGICG